MQLDVATLMQALDIFLSTNETIDHTGKLSIISKFILVSLNQNAQFYYSLGNSSKQARYRSKTI